MTSRLSPFLASHLGFSRLFGELDDAIARGGISMPTYPPYNVSQDEKTVRVEVALAGFKRDDLKVQLDRSTRCLTIASEKTAEDETKYVRRGIGRRAFSLVFKIADDLEVSNAKFEDGLLIVDLSKIEHEENKPLLIPIN